LSGLNAKPNKPKQQNLFLKFGFVGFRKEPLNPTYMTVLRHISLNRTRVSRPDFEAEANRKQTAQHPRRTLEGGQMPIFWAG